MGNATLWRYADNIANLEGTLTCCLMYSLVSYRYEQPYTITGIVQVVCDSIVHLILHLELGMGLWSILLLTLAHLPPTKVILRKPCLFSQTGESLEV